MFGVRNPKKSGGVLCQGVAVRYAAAHNLRLSYRRHDISESVWESLEPLLLGSKGTWGGNARDNRQFINTVFWILRTGAPWRDLPP